MAAGRQIALNASCQQSNLHFLLVMLNRLLFKRRSKGVFFYLSLILVSYAREADVGRVVGLLSHLVSLQEAEETLYFRWSGSRGPKLVRLQRTKVGQVLEDQVGF